MIAKIADVIRSLDQKSPLRTAEEWDNVGLLIGDSSQSVSRSVVSIDLTSEAIDLAIQKKASLIVTHHPCIFPKKRGITKVLSSSLVYKAIQNNIAVAAYHTNFDQCALEVVHSISQGLGLSVRGRLFEKENGIFGKLVTYVPPAELESVRSVLFEAGAGKLGQYDHCSLNTPFEGTFRGNVNSKPARGKPGSFEKFQEQRLEVVFPLGIQDQVIAKLKESHSYEEPAYEIYPIERSVPSHGIVSGLGYGFWGEFPSPKPFSELAKDVKRLFNIHGFWITNPLPSHVTRVGFVAGKGASFVDSATHQKCDLFITGEAGYHVALGGLRRGTAVMELGHRESELFFIKTMKTWLSDLGLEVEEAQTPTQQIWSGGIQ